MGPDQPTEVARQALLAVRRLADALRAQWREAGVHEDPLQPHLPTLVPPMCSVAAHTTGEGEGAGTGGGSRRGCGPRPTCRCGCTSASRYRCRYGVQKREESWSGCMGEGHLATLTMASEVRCWSCIIGQ